MKLSKIYSNKSSFKAIIFNEGFNVVYGDVKDSKTNKVQEHNLGKTTLIHLIDFLLLKKIDCLTRETLQVMMNMGGRSV